MKLSDGTPPGAEVLTVSADELEVGDMIEEGRRVIDARACCGFVKVHHGVWADGEWRDPQEQRFPYGHGVRVIRGLPDGPTDYEKAPSG